MRRGARIAMRYRNTVKGHRVGWYTAPIEGSVLSIHGSFVASVTGIPIILALDDPLIVRDARFGTGSLIVRAIDPFGMAIDKYEIIPS